MIYPNNSLADFTHHVRFDPANFHSIFTFTSPTEPTAYSVFFRKQKPYQLWMILEQGARVEFDVIAGTLSEGEINQPREEPIIKPEDLPQMRLHATRLFGPTLQGTEFLADIWFPQLNPPVRPVKQKAAKPAEKPAAPTQEEIDQAKRERELLEKEEKRRKDPVFKELKKMVDCVNQDINYLNGVIRKKQRPKPARAQEIVQHLRSMHRMEKMAISPDNKELLEQLIEKRKSLEFLLLKSLNKLNTASKAQDTEFNRFNTTYKIPRGSNIIGHPVGKLFDLPRAYKYKPEDFVRDTSNSISRNEVQKTVGLQFFDSSAPAKTATPVDQFLRSLVTGKGC